MNALLLVALSLSGVFALNVEVSVTSSLSFDAAEAKKRPVSKVIHLLKDMLKQMEKEGEEDQDIYEKMGCWCITYEKEKTKSIADAQARIITLQSTIESTTADSAKLNAEIAQLQKESSENTVALEEAEALRAKQLAEFNQEEKETLKSITSVKGAVQVLSKVHESSFLQVSAMEADTMTIDIATKLRDLYRQHQAWFKDALSSRQREAFSAFVQQTGNGFSLSQASAPASGAIFGILKQMKEDMETSLANSAKEEETNVKDYEALKAAKTQQVADADDLVETKTGELATSDEKKATSKTDLEETQASLDADNKFLSDLKVRCTNMDAEFEQRTKARQLEMQAVSKALEFLSSDEAHDLFTRTFNPALVQVQARTVSKRRAAAARLFQEAAKKAQDPRLSTLAVKARLDAFEEVKKTIQDMIDKLLKEKDDDVKHKDYCIDEFNTNEVDTTNKQREVEQIKAKIEDLHMSIDELDQAIVTLKEEVVELEQNMKSASAQREKANAEFQQTVSDQRATQKLLTASLGVLKTFYEKAALVQIKAHTVAAATAKQPPPPGFKSYETNAASGGVMGMMQKIIDEAKELEAEAQRGEADAQEDFEEFVKDTKDSIDAKNKDIIDKSDQLAKDEEERVQKEAERDSALTNLEELAQGNADLHNSCDFLLKNFDLRVTARDGEVEALKQGLALFSGASFGAFLQRA